MINTISISESYRNLEVNEKLEVNTKNAATKSANLNPKVADSIGQDVNRFELINFLVFLFLSKIIYISKKLFPEFYYRGSKKLKIAF